MSLPTLASTPSPSFPLALVNQPYLSIAAVSRPAAFCLRAPAAATPADVFMIGSRGPQLRHLLSGC